MNKPAKGQIIQISPFAKGLLRPFAGCFAVVEAIFGDYIEVYFQTIGPAPGEMGTQLRLMLPILDQGSYHQVSSGKAHWVPDNEARDDTYGIPLLDPVSNG